MVTTILDLLGSLLIIAGLAVWVSVAVAIAAGLATAGAGLLALSWIIDRPRYRGIKLPKGWTYHKEEQ